MNEKKLGLLILGFGGHARSVADIALSAGIKNLIFVDANARDGENFLGSPVVKNWDEAIPSGWEVFPAAGNNQVRRLQCEEACQRGWPIATLIASTASIGIGSFIGQGVLIAHQAHIGPMSKIGDGAIINTGAVIEHESEIGDFSHVSVNSTVAGRCKVGENVFLGAGSTVIDGINIVDNVMLGAGGCVISSILQQGTYIGLPAKAFVK